MGTRVWQTPIPLLLASALIRFSLLCPADAHSSVAMCPRERLLDFFSSFPYGNCVVSGGAADSPYFAPVTDGDEVSLHKALNLVHKNSQEYVALLFHASWCPFSRIFRPSFSLLSYLYPSIPHFAIEESSVRPSILSKYGVQGFPTLFLLNSTIRVRYQGSRTLGSLVAFYSDVTGIKTASLDKGILEKMGRPSNHEKRDSLEQESCRFSWARSPENLFSQETYLALATAFVLLRLLYLFFPTLLLFARFAWGWYVQNVRMGSLLDHPQACLNRGIQLLNSLKEPCKKSNLQGGARNAKAWASKSLATVSIGDASTSRGTSMSESR